MIKLKSILLNEQYTIPGGNSMYPSYQAVKSFEEPVTDAVKSTMKWLHTNRHTLIDIAALGTSFLFPPAAVAIELYNAKLYYDEGDKLMGDISVIFAALPIIGEIPGVKQAIGSFIKRGTQYSLRQIDKILKTIVKYKDAIRRKFLFIESMINKFPYLNLDKHLTDLVNGKIDAKTFYKKFTGYDNTMEVITLKNSLPLQHGSLNPKLTPDKLNLTGFLDDLNLVRPGASKRAAAKTKDALNKPGGFYTTHQGVHSGFYSPPKIGTQVGNRKHWYNFELPTGARGLDVRNTGWYVDAMSVGDLTKYKADGFDFIIGKGMTGGPEIIPLRNSVIKNWKSAPIMSTPPPK